jgi:uncharacterized protein (TIGR02118 family)
MYKLIALFTTPADAGEFEAHWSGEFVPLAEKMPGLRRAVVSRIEGTPAGPAPYYLIHELYFDDRPALESAMASPEGTSAGQTLMSFAANDVTLLLAEHLEDENLKTQTPNP